MGKNKGKNSWTYVDGKGTPPFLLWAGFWVFVASIISAFLLQLKSNIIEMQEIYKWSKPPQPVPTNMSYDLQEVMRKFQQKPIGTSYPTHVWCSEYVMVNDGRNHTQTKADIDNRIVPEMTHLENKHFELNIGGHYRPPNCYKSESVALVLPYRNREENLRAFLAQIHPLLQRQQLHYAIFLVEQDDDELFNRGILLNVGFVEAMRLHNWTCFIFHDVDKVPYDDRQDYTCPPQGYVRHMTQFQDRFDYVLPWREDYFGGVTAITAHDVYKINGFSNIFYGYGFEDDEMLIRCKMAGLKPYREHPAVATFANFGHSDKPNTFSVNENLLKSAVRRAKYDGLSTLKYYDLQTKVDLLPLFVKVRIVVKPRLALYRAHFRTYSWQLAHLVSKQLRFKGKETMAIFSDKKLTTSYTTFFIVVDFLTFLLRILRDFPIP